MQDLLDPNGRSELLDLRERAAELVEAQAARWRKLRSETNPNTHYARSLAELAEELDRVATSIRQMPLTPKASP